MVNDDVEVTVQAGTQTIGIDLSDVSVGCRTVEPARVQCAIELNDCRRRAFTAVIRGKRVARVLPGDVDDAEAARSTTKHNVVSNHTQG